jgi:hypothetical protein
LSPFGNLTASSLDVYGKNAIGMSADGNTIFFRGSNVGGFYVKVMKYNSITNRWNQLGSSIKYNGTLVSPIKSSALSSDGNNVIVMSKVGKFEEERERLEVRVYKLVRDDWVQVGARISVNERRAYFNQVDISRDGSVIALLSLGGDFVSLYKLQRSPIRWEQLGSSITPNGFDYMKTIALSADGTVVAIGDEYADILPGQSGVTLIYKYNTSNSSWVQVGSLLRGGAALALSADGTKVAIANRETNDYSVYKFSSSMSRWLRVGPAIPALFPLWGEETVIAISADGRTIALGESNRFSPDKARVSVHTLMNSSWSRVDINATRGVKYFGENIAMSDDGTKIVTHGFVITKPWFEPSTFQVNVYELKQCKT